MPAPQNSTPKAIKPVSVVIAYDEPDARLIAIRVYPHLMEEKGWHRESDCLWWSFDELNHESNASCAQQAAEEADMVIIATKKKDRLPPEMEDRIRGWLTGREGTAPLLVGLVIYPTGERPPAYPLQYSLQTLAREHRITFRAYRWQMPPSHPDYCLDALMERSETVTHLLEEILEHSFHPHRKSPHSKQGK
jgi:hypothetical protein